MRLARYLAAALVAAGFALPATAEDAVPDCADGARPVVSEGLPRSPCGAKTGVVINRGPEVAPPPSRAGEAWAPTEGVPRRVTPADPFGYRRPVVAVPVYPAYPYPPRSSGFRLVVRGDDFYLGLGNGPGWPWPHPKPRGHGRHDGKDREDPRETGFGWPREE